MKTKIISFFGIALQLMKVTLAFVIVAFATSCEKNTPETSMTDGQLVIDSTRLFESGCTVKYLRVHSTCMERDIKTVVVLPPAYDANPAQKFPILYTLNGTGAPYDTWAEMPKLQAQLGDKPFIYICFDGDYRSWYIDAKITTCDFNPASSGLPRKSLFTTFFFEEFMPAIEDSYRVDTTKRGVTGFSMGGFGSLHYALSHPKKFCSVSGLSSLFLDVSDSTSMLMSLMKDMLGPFQQNRADFLALDQYRRIASLTANGVTIPPVYLSCGADDPLVVHSRRMKAYMDSLGVAVEYVEVPGGHNWEFWHPASIDIAAFHWKYFSKP